MLVRIANRVNREGLPCLSRPFCKQLLFEILEHLPYNVQCEEMHLAV